MNEKMSCINCNYIRNLQNLTYCLKSRQVFDYGDNYIIIANMCPHYENKKED